jgi:hypothetical protein
MWVTHEVDMILGVVATTKSPIVHVRLLLLLKLYSLLPHCLLLSFLIQLLQ